MLSTMCFSNEFMIIKATVGNITITIANKLTIKRTLSELKKELKKTLKELLAKNLMNRSKKIPRL